MPITAKLSRTFYDKLGDEATDELVNWLNAVDTSYRQEFRELFDANFGRLDARLAQQIAELRAETHTAMGRLETRMIRWMVGLWFISWVTTVATLVALQRLR